MLCDKCKKNEATVHIKEFHNGKCTDIHLCDECAKTDENAPNIPGIGFNLAEVLFNVGKLANKISGQPPAPQEDKTVCPVCAWTPEKIRQHNGKLGCPACYQTFDKLIKEGGFQSKAFLGWAKANKVVELDNQKNPTKPIKWKGKLIRAVILNLPSYIETDESGFVKIPDDITEDLPFD